jgi:hypothetical protein
MPRVAFDVSRLLSQRDLPMEEMGSFMSDDERKRPATQGWTFSPTGGMTRNSGEVVVLEEAASVPSAVDRREEPTAPKHVPPPMPAGRKSAVEEFNDELAVLERPLEVEYFDDEKPPSRWRQAAGFMAVVVVVGVGGALLISRNRAAADARELAAGPASPAPAAAAAAAAAPSPALAAAQTPPAPEAPAADEAAADSAGEDSAGPAPATRSAWTKVRTKPGHSKHARSGSSKTASHRTTKTKRTVIAKNTVSRRH